MPVRPWNRSAKTEREQPASVASEATVQSPPGVTVQRRDSPGQARVAQGIHETGRAAATAFNPTADDDGRDDVGEPGQNAGKTYSTPADLVFHRLQDRQDLGMTLG